ncbi:hypothetical protein ABEB36_000522 [Hypothenemus hampei]|uniref:Uncharacterized protein n=1 Tax=Hypothenemus hampei TaxID=57062 RepID=A0ABD1FBJ9_HYPHA
MKILKINSMSLFVAILSISYALPQYSTQIPILHMELKNDTGNKILQEEIGDAASRQGSYSYVAPDGQQVSMTYVADAEGFRPQGSHMPVPPPMPEAIRKAVEQNLAEEARGIVDDGQYHQQVPVPVLPLKFRV